ncbi:MAG TPA: hypothetical protein VE057_15425 [Archangium sp.]|nr:hypothetical protein [Archangium sp.]
MRHLEAFRALFVDTLRVASQSGLKKVGHLSVDGTKMKANASKHKVMSYGRMDEAMKKLDEQVERLLAEAEELDAQEDERHGKGRRGDELPEEMKDPKKRAERLREAARQVEAEKKVALAVEKEKRRERIGQAKQELEEQATRFSLRGCARCEENSRWRAPSTTSRRCGSRVGNCPARPRRPRSGEVAARRHDEWLFRPPLMTTGPVAPYGACYAPLSLWPIPRHTPRPVARGR